MDGKMRRLNCGQLMVYENDDGIVSKQLNDKCLRKVNDGNIIAGPMDVYIAA